MQSELKRIARLEAKVSRMQKQINNIYKEGLVDRPLCALCGSNLRLNTGNYYCTQDFGVCGELFLSGAGGRGHPKAYFRRTQYNESLELENFKPLAWKPIYHVAFIGNRQMTVVEYLKWWTLKSKQSL